MDACLALVSQIFAVPAQGVLPGQESFDLAAVVSGPVISGQWGHSSHYITITYAGIPPRMVNTVCREMRLVTSGH